MCQNGQTIFVAGATGLTGSAIIKKLLAQDPSSRIKGSYHTTPPFFFDQRLEYVKADLTNREDCRKAVSGCRSAVLAAASTGGAQMANFQSHKQMTDNLIMDALLLETLALAGVKRIIYLSSATVYQPFDGYIREDELDWNQDPHPSYLGVGWAKRSAEKLCYFWHRNYQQEIIILRCANIYGPYAKFDKKTSNFIPALIRKAVDKIEPFEVWGNAEVARDVIFADDVAQAVALFLFQNSSKFDIFNMGYGETTTVGEVVNLVLDAEDYSPHKLVYSDNMPTTIGFRALDCSKLTRTLNWRPAYSLKEGIKITMDWWKKNKESWHR